MSKLPENCPICGNRMEEGKITGGGEVPSLWWVPPDWSLKFWRNRGKKGERIQWGFAMCKGFRCPKCKVVLFSYGEEPKGEPS